jgi:hypothetical protein
MHSTEYLTIQGRESQGKMEHGKMGLAAMKTTANLSAQQYREMREMLKKLTPAERASLKDPDFITEDEADLIICDRRDKEDGPSIPLEQILKEFGTSSRRRLA